MRDYTTPECSRLYKLTSLVCMGYSPSIILEQAGIVCKMAPTTSTCSVVSHPDWEIFNTEEGPKPATIDVGFIHAARIGSNSIYEE